MVYSLYPMAFMPYICRTNGYDVAHKPEKLTTRVSSPLPLWGLKEGSPEKKLASNILAGCYQL